MGNEEYTPACHEDCFDYGMFGWVNGCGAGISHEAIEPGQPCLYPDLRHICKPIGSVSIIELCAALEGEPIKTIPKGLDRLGDVQISVSGPQNT